MSRRVEGPELLIPQEVAALYRVDPKTIARWAAAGKISFIRTPGGWRRYHRDEVNALLAGEPMTPAQVEAMWAAWRNGGAR